MKSSTQKLAGCLLVLLAQGALAQSAPSKAPPTIRQPSKIIPQLFTQSADDFECSSSPCTITIKMEKGEGYCQGTELPAQIKVSGARGSEKTIVWKLDPRSIDTAVFYFQPKYGILVVDDKKSQLKDGVRTDPTTYQIKNKHTEKGEATYLPIILQFDTVTQAISLCGATDPKIVND